jgi:hypothetical protein
MPSPQHGFFARLVRYTFSYMTVMFAACLDNILRFLILGSNVSRWARRFLCKSRCSDNKSFCRHNLALTTTGVQVLYGSDMYNLYPPELQRSYAGSVDSMLWFCSFVGRISVGVLLT